MIEETLQWAAKAMDAQLVQGSQAKVFIGVSTDTRKIVSGNLFFCLMGQRDGHNFAELALQSGASALVVDEAHITNLKAQFPQATLLLVSDTLKALGDLAQKWRQKFSIPIIALTGSNGKTTTKEMIKALLETRYRVLATAGNFNNLIGVPKTLFGLSDEHEIAVVEMGMNDFGEIARLTEIAQPTVGLITNIASAHLEKLKDISGVARAKSELFSGLSEKSIAFVNTHDPHIIHFLTRAQRVKVGSKRSDIQGEVLPEWTAEHPLQLKIQWGNATDTLAMKIPGAHNLDNVLLALAVAKHFGVTWAQCKQVLENFQPAPSRMEWIVLNAQQILLNDCYNANPDSIRVALKTLADLKAGGKSLAILGEMAELGENAAHYHFEVGALAANLKTDYLVGVGGHAQDYLQGAQQRGMALSQLRAFANAREAEQFFEAFPSGVTKILLKGSRVNQLETLLPLLKKNKN